MAHTCRIFTPEEVAEWSDKANKLGWVEKDRFRVIDLGQEDKHKKVAAYTNYAYSTLNNNKDYGALVVPRKTSVPLVYVSNSDHEEWGYHRDDSNSKEMKREYTVILALNDASEYEGGEIVVRDGGAEVNFKLPAGMCVVTPTSTYIKLNKVNAGVRAICRWTIESYIKNKSFFNINLQYNQLYSAFREGLSAPADELFSLTNNMLLNEVAHFDLDDDTW